MPEQHEWRVGDLCKATYNNIGEGLVYRVTKVDKRETWPYPGVQTPGHPPKQITYILTVKPVYGVLASIENRKTRKMGAMYCTYVSIADMGMEYMKFGNFIRDEALRLGADLKEPPKPPQVDEDDGVCADIAGDE